MKKHILWIFVMFLIVLPIIHATPLQTAIYEQEKALTIVYPKVNVFQKDAEAKLNFDVLNSTYSRMTNTTSTCIYDIIHSNGTFLDSGDLDYNISTQNWYFSINSSLTSSIGIYYYYIHCSDTSGQNGYGSSTYEVTNYQGAVRESEEPWQVAIGVILVGIMLYSFVMSWVSSQSKDDFLRALKTVWSTIGLSVMLVGIRLIGLFAEDANASKHIILLMNIIWRVALPMTLLIICIMYIYFFKELMLYFKEILNKKSKKKIEW